MSRRKQPAKAGCDGKSQRGMTLLELLVVVVIIAILGSIAITSYRAQVIKSRRAAAATCLVEAVQAMERYYTTNLTYVGATTAALPTCDSGVTQFYTVAVSGTPAAKTFTVAATPTGTQASGDTLCGTISLNQAGNKGETGTASSGDECL